MHEISGLKLLLSHNLFIYMFVKKKQRYKFYRRCVFPVPRLPANKCFGIFVVILRSDSPAFPNAANFLFCIFLAITLSFFLASGSRIPDLSLEILAPASS